MKVFNSALGDFTTKFLVIGQQPQPPIQEFFPAHAAQEALLAEELLLFDSIHYKVWGENVPLTFLYNRLGYKRLIELLENGTINFVLWKNEIMHMVKPQPPLIPILSFEANSKPHTDPEESATLGLNWVRGSIAEKHKREIVKKASAQYVVPSYDKTTDALAMIKASYARNELESLGFPASIPLPELPLDKVKELTTIAAACNEIAILSADNISLYQTPTHLKLLSKRFDLLQESGRIRTNFAELLKLERVLDISELILKKHLTLDRVCKLRGSSSSDRFRKWLAESSYQDERTILELYMDAIEKPSGFFQTRKGKFTKTMTVFGLATLVGNVVAGPVGAKVGAALTPVVEKGIDLSLSLLDEFLLNRLIAGWSPRVFIQALNHD